MVASCCEKPSCINYGFTRIYRQYRFNRLHIFFREVNHAVVMGCILFLAERLVYTLWRQLADLNDGVRQDVRVLDDVLQ